MIKKYNEIRTGSVVSLRQDSVLASFNNEWKKVLSGRYFIIGFWADMCGISLIKNDDIVYIQSVELRKFENII